MNDPIEEKRVNGPNDPKLSDRGARHDACAAGSAGSRQHDVRSGSLQRMVRPLLELVSQWENRARQAFLRGDATSESVALTYVGCRAEIMAILAAPEEGASHTPAATQGSNFPQA